MSACHYTRCAGEDESEHDGVVLEVGIVDENGRRLHKDRYESYGTFPFRDSAGGGDGTVEDDSGGDVGKVFRDEDRSSHVDFK